MELIAERSRGALLNGVPCVPYVPCPFQETFHDAHFPNPFVTHQPLFDSAFTPRVPAGQAKRPINEKDLFRFTWVADPQMSPDGSQVAYVQVTANQEKDAYESSLWLVSTQGGKPRRLTNGPQDSAAVLVA